MTPNEERVVISGLGEMAAKVGADVVSKVGACPPFFIVLSPSGELSYGVMNFSNLRTSAVSAHMLWNLSMHCRAGVVVASCCVQRFGSDLERKLAAERCDIVGGAHYLYLRAEALFGMSVFKTWEYAAPVENPLLKGLLTPIADGFTLGARYMPGFTGPKELPPIFMKHRPRFNSEAQPNPKLISLKCHETTSDQEGCVLESIEAELL